MVHAHPAVLPKQLTYLESAKTVIAIVLAALQT